MQNRLGQLLDVLVDSQPYVLQHRDCYTVFYAQGRYAWPALIYSLPVFGQLRRLHLLASRWGAGTGVQRFQEWGLPCDPS